MLIILTWKCNRNWKPLVTLRHYYRTVYTVTQGERPVKHKKIALSHVQHHCQHKSYAYISLLHWWHLCILIDLLLVDEWRSHSLPPAERDSPPSPFSINCHTAVCVCVYRQPTLMSRSQGCKTLNRFTVLQIITMATWLERGYKTEWLKPVQCHRIYQMRQFPFPLWHVGH